MAGTVRHGHLQLRPWLTEAVARMPRNKAAVAPANKLARIAWSLFCAMATERRTMPSALWSEKSLIWRPRQATLKPSSRPLGECRFEDAGHNETHLRKVG